MCDGNIRWINMNCYKPKQMLNNNVQKLNVKAMCKKRMYKKYVNTVSVADPDHFYRIRTISTGSAPFLPDPDHFYRIRTISTGSAPFLPDPDHFYRIRTSSTGSDLYKTRSGSFLYSLQNSKHYIFLLLYSLQYSINIMFCVGKKLEPATSRLKNKNISG